MSILHCKGTFNWLYFLSLAVVFSMSFGSILCRKHNGFASDSLCSLLSVLPNQASLGQKGSLMMRSSTGE